MREGATRREFLKFASVGGTAMGLGGLAFLGKLPPVSAQEARLDPALVAVDASIAPLVRLIEDTPREQVFEPVADRIRQGTTYQEVVAALFLAAIRNIAPRPTLGFKFHGVLVIYSAHMASLASPDGEDRWLPIFWALDSFKEAQAQEESGDGWQMSAIDESAVPSPPQARAALHRSDGKLGRRAGRRGRGGTRALGRRQRDCRPALSFRDPGLPYVGP